MTSSFYFFLAPSVPLGLSLSAPSGILQQAFGKIKPARVERSSTLDAPEQEPGTAPATEAGLGPNSNNILAPPEAVPSTVSTSFPGVPLTSTATSSPPSSTGRVSPPPISTQSQTPAAVTTDPSPPPQSSNESAPSQLPPAATSSTISPPSVQTSVPAVPGPQLGSSSVSSVAGVTSSSTVPASEQQPFNSAVSSSQPGNSSIHAPQHTTSQCQPVPISAQPAPPTSLPSQTQPQPVESEELQNKTAGRDDIQALDKKLRSLFKDQSSSSASVDQNTGTSSPPTGTSSPPPGAALVPPSNLPLTSGVQGVLGPTTTPGQGVTPAGQTPPTKPRAQVSENCSIQEQIQNDVHCNDNILTSLFVVIF